MDSGKKRTFFNRPFWTGAALLLVTFLAFVPALENDFVTYDDPMYVTENPAVRSGLNRASVSWAFKTFTAGNWHPLTWLSHMLDTELYGMNPRGHHASSIVFHMLNILLLWIVLRRMTGSFWPAVFAAAFFGVHPLRAESVAWISERKDVLCAFFGLLTLLAYERYARRPSPLRYLAVFAGLTLGLMSKPMLVTWPFVFLLLDYWPLKRLPAGGSLRSGVRLILEKIPFFVLIAGSSVIAYIAQHAGGAVARFDSFPFAIRAGNALASYVNYIRLFFFPIDLACLYPHPGSSLDLKIIVLSALLLISITAFCVWMIRRRPWLAVGWFWYLGTLVPVIGLIQVGAQAMADRYTYLPQIGLLIMLAGGLDELYAKKKTKWIPAGLMILLALSVFLTRQQTKIWRNSETLFRHALSVTKNNSVVTNNLGNELAQQGRADEAMEQYYEALRIRPNYPHAAANLGLLLTDTGRTDEARNVFSNIVSRIRDPGELLYGITTRLFMRERTEMALFVTHLLLELEPGNPHALNNAAWIMATSRDEALRDGKKAFEYAAKAVEILGDSNPALFSTLAAASAETGDFERAVQITEEIIKQALKEGKTRLAERHQRRLDRYRQGLPWRE